MPAGASSQFRTFQTVARYEAALARHAQYIRWTRAILCPCLNATTRQPDPQCSLCGGYGHIYYPPNEQAYNPYPFRIVQEPIRCDLNGKLYPKFDIATSPNPVVTLKGTGLSVAVTSPFDGSLQLSSSPYPQQYEPLLLSYDHDPVLTVTDEDSTVYDSTNFVLQVTTPVFTERDTAYSGTIVEVTEAYNTTKSETYTVTSFDRDKIYLSAMGTWEVGDVLEVDYKYEKPFSFMLIGVTPKLRYEQPWLLEEAEAVLITPYWAKPSPNDLFTVQSSEQRGSAIVDPTHTAGNDVIRNYYDISKIIKIILLDGTELTTGFSIANHNQIKWTSKPTQMYTIHFLYNSTYVALTQLPTLRTSENKIFANRISVKLHDQLSDMVRF